MLRAFGHPFATCCDMLGVVGSTLKMVKFLIQHLWMLHDIVIIWPVSCNNVAPGQHMSQHVATGWPNGCNSLRSTLLWSVAFKSPAKRSKHCNPTYRNINCWVQHVACVWPSCCHVLRHVGCCWLKFENVQIFHATFVDVAWCCSRLTRFVQQCRAKACALVRFWTRNISQHVVTGWPNACNMMRSTRPCKCWANIVGKCCVEMLLPFAGA